MESLKSFYLRLDSERQALFLATLACNLTICGRNAYPGATPGARDEDRWRRLQAVNEMQHTIARQLRALLSETDERYPDDVFCNIVAERGADVENYEWAIEVSMKSVGA